jgi:N,N'-diacetylchitobiose transport system substrate-binding protein
MAQVFADGHAAAYIDNTGGLAKVLKANPKLTMDDLGTFPFPGESGQIQPSTLAGSQWAIAQKSNLKELALVYLKIAGSPDIQNNDVFGVDGWIPNSLEAIKAAESSPKMTPQLKGFFDAAPRMRAPETAVHWATLEDDNSLNEFFGSVASGAKSPASAAKSIDAHIAEVLNAG